MVKKILLLATTAISLASAASLTIDDFSMDQGPLTSSGSTGAMNIGGGITRTLTLNALGGTAPIRYTMQVASGLLDMTNGTGETSEMSVHYVLPSLPVPMSATDLKLVLNVRETDGNITQVVLGGIAGGSQTIPGNTTNVNYSFGISGPPVGPGVLDLSFTGQAGWDMNITSVGLTWSDVPEPSTYALMGAGLMALSLLRRKA